MYSSEHNRSLFTPLTICYEGLLWEGRRGGEALAVSISSDDAAQQLLQIFFFKCSDVKIIWKKVMLSQTEVSLRFPMYNRVSNCTFQGSFLQIFKILHKSWNAQSLWIYLFACVACPSEYCVHNVWDLILIFQILCLCPHCLTISF